VLLTDYQEKKATPPLQLQIKKCAYLANTEIADFRLCEIARKQRACLLRLNETWAQKAFRFLAYVNQSDWRAKQLLAILRVLDQPRAIGELVKGAELDYVKKNKQFEIKLKPIIPESDFEAIRGILSRKPIELGVIDALDTWVMETLQDAARLPSAGEWKQLKDGPLNGRIGMSFALPWRFNFGPVFGVRVEDREEVVLPGAEGSSLGEMS
jgi:hypothetical protein